MTRETTQQGLFRVIDVVHRLTEVDAQIDVLLRSLNL